MRGPSVNLNAIEQAQEWRQPRVDGVGRPKFDFHRRWADGRVLSNLHRVRMPTGPECGRPRQSIAFFMQADKEALIESSGETITAGDYILGRIRSNFAAKFGDK